MIYDTLNNLPNYLGVSDNLDTVIEYIMARDLSLIHISPLAQHSGNAGACGTHGGVGGFVGGLCGGQLCKAHLKQLADVYKRQASASAARATSA